MKVAYPPLGNYTKLIKQLEGYFGWELIMPPCPSDKTVEGGSKYMHELMCLPAKLTLGSMIEVCADTGVSKLLMFDSCGQCRLKSYWILQQRALRKLGYNVTVYPIRLGKATPRDIQRVDPSIPYWKAWWAFVRALWQVKRLDDSLSHEIPETTDLVKIGLIGEIFTLMEPSVNRNLLQKLERMGVLVHNSLTLSYFIFKGLYNRGWMKRDGVDRHAFLAAMRQADEYFPKETIGGHGKESIIHTIYYGLKGFDGVIHVLPFPCAPEATVAPIVDDISQDYGIPVMRLIFDVHTGEAGLDTRLEAFVDILKRKKAKAGTTWVPK